MYSILDFYSDFSVPWLNGMDPSLNKDKVILKKGLRRRKLKR